MRDNDLLVFRDESPSDQARVRLREQSAWKILIVDDDEDVHQATELALRNTEILGKSLHFLHAYSATDAHAILTKTADIAVILLDVVMEEEHAGLKLVKVIREELALSEVRIVLRTGQPGYAPEVEAIRDYDINDYKSKTELTRTKLYSTLTTAIRSYSQIRALNTSRRGLEMIVHSSAELVSIRGYHEFSVGIITQITALLGLSPEGLVCARCIEPQRQPGESYFIVAAAGQFAGYVDQPLHDLKEPEVLAAIQTCLAARQNQVFDDHILLFLPNKSGFDMVVYLSQTRRMDDTERRLLEVFCANIAVCLDNVVMLGKLHHYAYFDSLLDLPNRLYFMQQVDDGESVAKVAHQVSLVDIDHFSAINDTLGSRVGDALLSRVAERLRTILPQAVFVARISGDRFALYGPANKIAPEAIRDIFADPFRIEDQEQILSVTQGYVALAGQGMRGNDALKKASIALKRAKELMRGDAVAFTREMEQETENRVHLLHNLRKALDGNRLYLAYQPQVTLPDARPVGIEALLRWRTDEGVLVPPNHFIPVAESAGLIVPLGEWVLRSAILEQKRIIKRFNVPLRMGVNVSMVQFRHPRFLQMLDTVIQETEADPRLIELEITESVAMIDEQKVKVLLGEITARGFTLAIDDFGTGFSSLSYLENLPIHRLKIDKSFIDKLQGEVTDSSIPEMILKLGQELDLTVIAEGVEEARQAEALSKMACHEAQGYLFAKPMEPKDLEHWLAARLGTDSPAK